MTKPDSRPNQIVVGDEWLLSIKPAKTVIYIHSIQLFYKFFRLVHFAEVDWARLFTHVYLMQDSKTKDAVSPLKISPLIDASWIDTARWIGFGLLESVLWNFISFKGTISSRNGGVVIVVAVSCICLVNVQHITIATSNRL